MVSDFLFSWQLSSRYLPRNFMTMALHHVRNTVLTCWVMFVMTAGFSAAFHSYPDSEYHGYNMIASCQSYSYKSFTLDQSGRALVYSSKGAKYSAGADCEYTFSLPSDNSGYLLVRAEKMGLEDSRACLKISESAHSSFYIDTELGMYCENTLFQLNTTKRYLKVQLVAKSYSEDTAFRLLLSPFFESGQAVYIETFNCDDGYKISKDMKSDGHQNCPDSSDEKDASALPCSSQLYSCGDSGPCIAKEWKCDRFIDCPNGTEEQNCEYKCPGSSDNGESYQLECKDKSGCYYQSYRCRGDSYSECADGSENKDCDDCDGYYGYYDDRYDQYCPMTRTCMTVEQFCDGVADCPNGADEEESICNPSIYWYWTAGQLAGLFIGFLIFVVIVIAIVAVVHKKCQKQVP